MALTYTVAGLETELNSVQVATDASDWTTAYQKLIRARLVFARLPRAEVEGVSVDFHRQIDDLTRLIEAAKSEVGKDRRRMVRTRVAYGD